MDHEPLILLALLEKFQGDFCTFPYEKLVFAEGFCSVEVYVGCFVAFIVSFNAIDNLAKLRHFNMNFIDEELNQIISEHVHLRIRQ